MWSSSRSGARPHPLFGTPGPGFTRLDIAPDTRLHGVALAANGSVLAPGVQTPSSTSGPRPIVLRLTEAGARDGTFGGGIVTIAPLVGEAYAAAELPDGKILVARYADSGGHDEFFLARLNPTGTLDTSGFGGGDGIAFTSFGLDAVRALDGDRALGRHRARRPGAVPSAAMPPYAAGGAIQRNGTAMRLDAAAADADRHRGGNPSAS